MSGTLLIRADGSVEMGTGHVMRCLALAQSWQEAGGEAVCAMARSTDALNARLAAEHVTTARVDAAPGSRADADAALALARARGAAWVVVDGYQFGADYQRWIKAGGVRLLLVDDNGDAAPYVADIILNQDGHAQESLYARRAPETRLLLGTRYALLRREFWPWRGRGREVAAEASKLLVTLGGSDPDNVTQKVLDALALLLDAGLEAVVVVGGSSPHWETLARAAERLPGVRLQSNVTDMPGLMAWADMAVTAGGSTCWELAFMGVPSLVMITADNQRASVAEMARSGTAVSLGWHTKVSPERLAQEITALRTDTERRRGLSAVSQSAVPGFGGQQIVAMLIGIQG